eukprot:UN14941
MLVTRETLRTSKSIKRKNQNLLVTNWNIEMNQMTNWSMEINQDLSRKEFHQILRWRKCLKDR